MTTKPLRVLWISFGPIGDTLMMLALWDEILRARPNATLTVITTRNAAVMRDLSTAYPSIRVLEIPRNPFMLGWFMLKLLTKRWTVIAPGTAGNYSFHIKLFCLAVGLLRNKTIGFRDQRRWQPFDVVLTFDYAQTLCIDNFRKVLPHLGITSSHDAPHVVIASVKPEVFPYDSGTYIVVHLFGASPKRSFPPKRWNHLLNELARQYPDLSLVVTGGTADEERAKEAIAGVSRTTLLINQPILQIAWIIEHAALYIGPDTGPTHLAGVLQKETVMVGNRSNPTWLPTYNPNATILYNLEHCTCRGDKTGNCSIVEDGVAYYRCMYEITDDAIFTSVRERLAQRKP